MHRPFLPVPNLGHIWKADAYLAWHAVLEGYPAKVWPIADVKSLMNTKRRSWSSPDRKTTAKCVQCLLESGAFESKSRARVLLPLIFDSPSTDAIRDSGPDRPDALSRQVDADAGSTPAWPLPPPATAERDTDCLDTTPVSSCPEAGVVSRGEDSPMPLEVTSHPAAAALRDATRAHVYSRWRAIFGGTKTLSRVRIMRIVSAREPDWEAPTVCGISEIIRGLVDDGIFSSESLARAEFPWLFGNSASANTHDRSPAAQADPPPLDDSIAGAASDNSGPSRDGSASSTRSPASRSIHHAVSEGTAVRRVCGLGKEPELPTVPFKTQHAVLTAAQEALEAACFDLVRRRVPAMLKKNGWDCAASVELNGWVSFLREEAAAVRLEPRRAKLSSRELDEVMKDVSRLRNVSVHRKHLPTKDICRLLKSAVKLARVLEDEPCAMRLQHVLSGLETRIRAAQGKTAAAMANLERLQEQREKLDLLEKSVRDKMARDGLRYKPALAEHFEEDVLKTFGKAVPPEVQNKSREIALALEGMNADFLPAGTEIEVANFQTQSEYGHAVEAVAAE
ncbi:hypothetical protein VUR80DRAFT_6058 [Thermomyces stellatus]